MMVNEMAKFWNPLQLRLSSCLYPSSASRCSSLEATAAASTLAMRVHPSPKKVWSAVLRAAGANLRRVSDGSQVAIATIASKSGRPSGRGGRRAVWHGSVVHDGERILIVGALLSAGLLASLLASRVRVPGLVLFLGVGMAVGTDGAGWIDFDDYTLARTVGIVA